jgi:hypothetical protein
MARTHGEKGRLGLPLTNGFLGLDTNHNLRGPVGRRTLREMRDDEPVASTIVNAKMTLCRYDFGVAPGGSTDPDKRAAEHLEQSITDMKFGMPQYARQMYGNAFTFGWNVHEVVYKRRNGGNNSRYNDGKVGWAHFGLRRPESLFRWETDPATDEVTSFIQRPAPKYQTITIPIQKCIHFVPDDTEGSPEGRSILRGMYRSWFIVKNLELLMGIALERFGTGLPIFEIDAAAPRLSDDDNTLLQDVAIGLRQNEEASLVLPPGVSFRFASSPGLTAKDYLDTITYLRIVMFSTVLADFIALGTKGGSYALGKDKTELFLLALNGYQERLLDTLNRQAVRQLIRYNDFGGPLTDQPRLTLPAISRPDLNALGLFAQVLNGIGAFHPTADDEAMFRKLANFVDVDPDTLDELHAADDAAPPQPMPPNPSQGQQTDDPGIDEGDTVDEEDLVAEEVDA